MKKVLFSGVLGVCLGACYEGSSLTSDGGYKIKSWAHEKSSPATNANEKKEGYQTKDWGKEKSATEEDVSNAQDEWKSEESDFSDISPRTGKESLAGFFVGCGLTNSSFSGNATQRHHFYKWEGDVGFGGVQDVTTILNELVTSNNFYILESELIIATNGATDHLFSFSAGAPDNRRMVGGKASLFGGTVKIGYGSLGDGDYYYGSEVSLDISGNKEKKQTDANIGIGFGEVKLKTSGVRPSASLLFGRYITSIDALVGLKLGGTLINVEAKSDYGSVKLKKVAPLVGFFARKNIDSNFSVGLEFDYIFQSRKDGEITRNIPVVFQNANNGPFTDSCVYTSKIRVESKGYAVRIMGIYKI